MILVKYNDYNSKTECRVWQTQAMSGKIWQDRYKKQKNHWESKEKEKEQDTQVPKGKKCNRESVSSLRPCKQKYVNTKLPRAVVKRLVSLKREV